MVSDGYREDKRRHAEGARSRETGPTERRRRDGGTKTPARRARYHPPMLALVFDGTVTLAADFPDPARAPNEAMIATRLAGVCDTDLQLIRGYMGFRGVLGHEFVGEVIDADNTAWVGRRVVADINAGCGSCQDCTSRDGHHCATRTVLGIAGRQGVMAERFVVPVRNLVAVPDSMPDQTAVFAEPLAAALHVLDEIEPGDQRPVAVVGDGKLGLLVCAALRSSGRPVTVFGRHEDKLAIAAGWGASVRGASSNSGPDELRYHTVVEASGRRSGLERAISLVAPRGTIVLKTTVSGQYETDLSPLVIHEVRLAGSRCGDLRTAIAALEAGTVDPSPLVEAEYPLGQAVHAMEHAGRPGARKVLIRCGRG